MELEEETVDSSYGATTNSNIPKVRTWEVRICRPSQPSILCFFARVLVVDMYILL